MGRIGKCRGRADPIDRYADGLECARDLVLRRGLHVPEADFVGTGHELPRVNHNRAIVMELTLMGAYNYDADGFTTALALLDSGALPLAQLIEPDDIRLDDLLPTMHRLAAGELPGKVMVTPRAERRLRRA